MSGRSFRSVFMVASCAGAALGCYLVSLRVASERASLESVETKIVLAQRELRVLQTEIGTRGRLAQLERWNAKVLALSAPNADQFLNGSFELARLTQPERKVDFEAPVVLAKAPAPDAARAPIGQPATDDAGTPAPASPKALLHEASLKTAPTTATREVPVKPAGMMPQPTGRKSTERPAAAARPDDKTSVDRPGLATAQTIKSPKKTVSKPDPASALVTKHAKKSVDRAAGPAAKAVTKPVRVAKTDPLAPLAGGEAAKTPKDSAQAR